ncbi:MAG: trigger factor [Clostridiales bacterium]|nr:trigger factor [Clostridiales bacterium]
MKSIVENTEENKVKITITVDAEAFEKANHSAYLKKRSEIDMPGFRKGKAPKEMIIKKFGEGVFYDEAFDIVFPESYGQTIKENDIHPVERPTIDILEIGKEGVKYTCEMFVIPEIKLGKYKGLKVEVPANKVTADMVDAQINGELEKIARWVDVEREVQTGDRTTIDYKGSVDDVAFEGGEAQGHALEIGSGSFIPGFEEQVIGMKVGDQKDITVTFPEEYHSEDLKGKDAKFEVKVNEIKIKELPELDDEFAKDVSEFDTLEEYRKDIDTKLKEQAQARTDNDTENLLIEKMAEGSEANIPQPMIDREVDYMVEDMGRRMSYQGINMEDYLKMTNTDINALREQFKGDAAKRVKIQLMFDEIKKIEKFEVSDEEIDTELEAIVKAQGGAQKLEEIKKTLTPENVEYVKDSVKTKKIMSLVKENAEIKVVAVKKKAPAKKKALAKKKTPAKKAETKTDKKD